MSAPLQALDKPQDPLVEIYRCNCSNITSSSNSTAPIHCECSLIWDCHLPLSSCEESYPVFLVHNKSVVGTVESRQKRAIASDVINEIRRRKDGIRHRCKNRHDRNEENENNEPSYRPEHRDELKHSKRS